jgi:TRAP-type C4-dicarboxylate transport system substrate-binding protein
VITLKYGAVVPESNPHALADLAWIEKIEKETNGRVKIEYYPGATIVSPTKAYQELIDGVCDISVSWPYEKFGREIMMNMQPWTYGVSDAATRISIGQEVQSKFPEIASEYAKTKILAFGMGNIYQLITLKPVRKVEDIEGMTFNARSAFADWINSMGGQGVGIPTTESYLAMQKNTIDGGVLCMETLQSVQLAEVAKYVTMVNVTSSSYPERAMNWDTWHKLPIDIQNVFNENYTFYGLEIARQFEIANAEGLDYGKKAGVEIIELTPEERNKFYEYLKTICINGAAELDDMGYPGTEIFNEVRRLADMYTK